MTALFDRLLSVKLHIDAPRLLLLLSFMVLSQHLACTTLPNPAMQQEFLLHQNWELYIPSDSTWIPAKVPGTVHGDLLAAGIIEDPYIGDNEQKYQWIEEQDWTYRCTFTVPDGFSESTRKQLMFEGLDTYAEVYLDDSLMLKADNMYRSWQVQLDELQPGNTHQLRVTFLSPVRIGKEKMAQLNYFIPAQNEQAPTDARTSVHTRKAPYHYGWDWGPRLVTSGIWQSVKLVEWEKARIPDVHFKLQDLSDSVAVYEVEIEAEAEKTGPSTFWIALNGKLLTEWKDTLQQGVHVYTHDLQISTPRLWWPIGLGEAYQYRTTVEVWQEGSFAARHEGKLGVAKIEMVQPQDEDGKGAGFFIQVNGKPVFAKGANYIPADVLIPRADVDQVIEDALAAHMNTLRVWGGAVYEREKFYERCAEEGILVWQDFMFACAMYPGDEGFLNNIEQEAIEQVKRLRKYPNLVIWAGNNEIWGAFQNWGWKQKFGYNQQQADTMWQHYQAIFYDLLPQVVSTYDSSKLYWPCSPAAAPDRESSPLSGDQHFWDVWFGEKPFTAYEEEPGRFISEYGFQGYPDLATLQAVADSQPLHWDSVFLRSRQRSPMNWIRQGFNGNDMIQRYLEKEFPIPDSFPNYVYLSQLLQAQALEHAIEAHRANRPYTMGSLYWQLDDCWPTVSWASVDYYGRWKAAHYQARRSFAPLMVTAQEKGDSLLIFGVSDYLERTPVKLELQLFDLEENKVVWRYVQEDSLEGQSAKKLVGFRTRKLIKKRNRTHQVLRIILTLPTSISAEKVFWFVPRKEVTLPKAKLSYSIEPVNGGCHLWLSSDTAAFSVKVALPDEWKISDNYVNVFPGTPRRLAITGPGLTPARLRSTVRLVHLSEVISQEEL
ncbi:MAG: glycoside hydrolase family 2 protein [Bacteroidota bacterium]